MAKLQYDKTGRLLFTKEMKKEYTILFPMMAPIHFNIIKDVFTHYGYKAVLLETTGPQIAQTGLKYVHNDTCYPAILVIGQMIDALNSGKYDLDHTALMITQTGGGCRASNYIHLLRKALKKAGYEKVPEVQRAGFPARMCRLLARTVSVRPSVQAGSAVSPLNSATASIPSPGSARDTAAWTWQSPPARPSARRCRGR